MAPQQWQPKTGGIVAAGGLGLALGTAAVALSQDPAGRLLAAVASLGLLTFAILSWRTRPKLTIADDALVVRTWFSTSRLRREDIASIRITEFRRIGRTVKLLEIDTAEDVLIVFSRWDLGADPLDALDALTDAGYVPPPRHDR